MSLGRALLWGIGLMSVAFGMAYLVSPVSMLELTGGSASTPAAATDVRATYGGFQLGLGAFLIWSALASQRVASALLALSLIAGAIGGCRLLGVLIDGGFGPTLLIGPIHISALVFELATGVLAFVAFSRARDVGLSVA